MWGSISSSYMLNRDTRRQNHLPLLPCSFSFNIMKGSYINLICYIHQCCLQFSDDTESWRSHQVSESGSEQWEENRFCTVMATTLTLGALSHPRNGKRQSVSGFQSQNKTKELPKKKAVATFNKEEQFWNVQYTEMKSCISIFPMSSVSCIFFFLSENLEGFPLIAW